MNNINQPRWKKVEYSRSQIIKAGKTIKNENITLEEKKNALKVIDNWRAAHAYPLQVIYMHLKQMAQKNDSCIIVAQRLKRLDSIIGKLKREQSMSLWTMQDLGGCRFIVKSINDVLRYYEMYKNSRVRHRFIRDYNYINNPKDSGYRSLHAVYEFHSDTKNDYNNNIRIEIQFRTHLQHLWATAVETMGLFSNQAIKSGKGNNDIKRFFALVSSLFAIQENMPIVPKTPADVDEIVHEIESINAKYNYLDFLSGIKVLTKFEESEKYNNDGYCILRLDYEERHLHIKQFKASQIEIANKEYNDLENKQSSSNIDSVLVRVSSFNTLKSAYPNYFSDIGEFIKIVKGYLR